MLWALNLYGFSDLLECQSFRILAKSLADYTDEAEFVPYQRS